MLYAYVFRTHDTLLTDIEIKKIFGPRNVKACLGGAKNKSDQRLFHLLFGKYQFLELLQVKFQFSS